MAKPSRNSKSGDIQGGSRTFFVTSRTALGKSILQTERMANLLIDVMRSYVTEGRFKIHDFVVMRDHFHALVTIESEMTIEKTVQLIKGNFSYRAKKELGYHAEIWQRGFSDERVWDRESFLQHRSYIYNNPVKAGYVDSPENYPYSSAYFRKARRA